MLVNYAKPNILNIPLLATFDKKKTVAEQNAVGKKILLTPGVNEVSKKDWDTCVKHYPKIKKLMDDNLITVEFDQDGDDEKPALSLMDVKQAKLVVKKTNNPILLEQWLNSETRPGVVGIINERLTEIEKLTKPGRKKQA